MENKKSKKKVLLYYLILAACLLIIAAVTVTVVFTVGRKSDQLADKDTQQPDDGKTPDDGNDDDQTTGTDGKYRLPVDNSDVTCGYEFSADITLDRFLVHQGMDFAGKVGDKVYAALDGKVTEVVRNDLLNENYVTISHADGMTSTYRYIDAKDGLKKGDTVKKGDVIGTIAAAGGYEMKQGPHLHFEMETNGRTVDPDTFLDIIEK